MGGAGAAGGAPANRPPGGRSPPAADGSRSLGVDGVRSRRWGGRFSPLLQIGPGNVGRLRPAWTFRTGEASPEFATRGRQRFQATPLAVDGRLYFDTPLSRVFALDATTGAVRWVYDARIDRAVNFRSFASRGVATWLDSLAPPGAPCRRRLYLGTADGRLVSLDAGNGRPCAGFGRGGTVDLREGLRTAPDPEHFALKWPPAVVGDLIVAGSSITDNRRAEDTSGEVRAFDARSGRLRWSWDPVPQDSRDPAYSTWAGPTAHRAGGANVWSGITVDADRDLLFLPTTSPSPDHYGGHRRGHNRYANSVVALRASTGKVAWHFQVVHHDLWDYDLPSPPTLASLRRDGKRVDAVLQSTKTGQLFVLERESGRPLFPVVEAPVPPSDVPGEEASPTQPFNSVLPPLSPQRLDAAEAWGPTPADREACRRLLAGLRNEGIFTPPSVRGSIFYPANFGGAHWGGLVFDPQRAIAVIPTNRVPGSIRLVPRGSEPADPRTWSMNGTPYEVQRTMLRSPSGLPCSPPPFGALVALDLATGGKMWEVPLGLNANEPWGTENLGGPIATASGLVFIGGARDAYLRAFAIETGVELWKGKLPATGQATPITYEAAGRQYVVIAAGGDGLLASDDAPHADSLVAFALPPPETDPSR